MMNYCFLLMTWQTGCWQHLNNQSHKFHILGYVHCHLQSCVPFSKQHSKALAQRIGALRTKIGVCNVSVAGKKCLGV